MLAYADKVTITTRSKQELTRIRAFKKLEACGQKYSLTVNEQKFKYIEMLKPINYKFNCVRTFNYLGVAIGNNVGESEEPSKKLLGANKSSG